MAAFDMLPSAVSFINDRKSRLYMSIAPDSEAVVILHEYCIDIEGETECKSDNFVEQVQFQSHVSYSMQMNYLNGSKHEKLCYSGQQCHRIPEALVKIYGPKVQSLDLSYNELVSLRGLEGFPLLRELVLDNNQLSDSLVLPYLPHLHTFSLNKNCINDIELLITKIMHNLPSLTYLSLLGNKACPNQLSDIDKDEEDYQRYRYYVLHHLPNLHFLDSSRVKQSERMEAKIRGQYMKVVRPKPTNTTANDDSPILHSLTPLSRHVRKPEDHRGVYEKCRYKYSGKHSEGNRFISNNDL